jgi:dTMP kinase
VDVVLTREPGGTQGAEAIRHLLLSIEGEGWNARAEALLFAAARSDHVERLIKPSLERGAWVICDRFLDSSRAYQGSNGSLLDADILQLHQIGSQGFVPDITLLISVSPNVAAARLQLRDAAGSDRIGGRSAEYHARVDAAFKCFAVQEPNRFTVIDGDGSPEETQALVISAVSALLDRQ